MPNANTHMLVGAGVGISTALLDKNKHPVSHHIVIAPVVGAFMGRLPDIIEPANHPNHRQFFHSVGIISIFSYGLIKAYQWSPDDTFDKFIRGLLLIGGAAYLCHLFCDASTPKSLPLIGNL